MDKLMQWFYSLMPQGTGQSRRTKALVVPANLGDALGMAPSKDLVMLNSNLMNSLPAVAETMGHENVHTALGRMGPDYAKLRQSPDIQSALPSIQNELDARGYSSIAGKVGRWFGEDQTLDEGLAYSAGSQTTPDISASTRQRFINAMLAGLKSQGKDTTLLEKVLPGPR